MSILKDKAVVNNWYYAVYQISRCQPGGVTPSQIQTGGYLLPRSGQVGVGQGVGVPPSEGAGWGYPLPRSRQGTSSPHQEGWVTPPHPYTCEQTENITFCHPSDVGGNKKAFQSKATPLPPSGLPSEFLAGCEKVPPKLNNKRLNWTDRRTRRRTLPSRTRI